MRNRTILLPALLGLALAGGCKGDQKVDGQEVKAQAREAGDELKSAAKEAGDAAQEAAEKGVDATKKAAAEAKDALKGDDHPDRPDSVRARDTVRQ
jgi:hypothetical protein